MAKWYRISISLAGKCRLGFATAVLLIIGAALFVPYRWMDKLVEQGKLELAEAEVQHILVRHFRPFEEDAGLSRNSPLALASDGSIKNSRWTTGGSDPLSGGTGARLYIPAPEVGGSVGQGGLGGELVQSRPLVEWIRVPNGLSMRVPTETLVERRTSDIDGNGRKVKNKPESAGAREIAEEKINLPGDAFVQRGMREFLRHRNKEEIFDLHYRDDVISADQGYKKNEDGIFEKLDLALTWGQPARYLRAVRASRDCLKGGCHSSTIKQVFKAEEADGPPIFQEGELVGVISIILPTGETGTTLLFNRIFIVVAGLLASITAVIAFYLITQRFILQPVRSLREAVDQVTIPEGGEAKDSSEDEQASWQEAMVITEKIRTGDEFERMAGAFHQMLGRLKLAHDRLRETNRALDLQLGELRARNIALFESSKLKSEFLANVSHELRTPLNAIIGFAEVVKEHAEKCGEAKTSRYAGNILGSGKRLLAIINDLLDLAKIEAGKVQMRWGWCSIQEITEVLLNFTRPLAEEKELQINLDIDKKMGLIETDGGKLQQILFNLLSNAIKFTPLGGRIDIAAQLVEDDYVRVSVADTGPGIAERDRETIFEKFRQVDASVTREHSGTGLGLAIVKELVDILGGTITVDSEVGKGAVFTVQLSVRRKPERETEGLAATKG